MRIAYFVYALVLCAFMVYANARGWSLADSFAQGKWAPRGHSIYHK